MEETKKQLEHQLQVHQQKLLELCHKAAEIEQGFQLCQLQQGCSPTLVAGCQAGIIKYFEVCYQIALQCAKDVLSQRYGIEMSPPKQVFAEYQRLGLIDQTTADTLIKMIDDYIIDPHLFDEKSAAHLSGHIPSYLKALEYFAQRIKN